MCDLQLTNQAIKLFLVPLPDQSFDDLLPHLRQIAHRAGLLAIQHLDQVVAVFGADRLRHLVERQILTGLPEDRIQVLGKVAQIPP